MRVPDVGVGLVNYRTTRLAADLLQRWSRSVSADSRIASIVVVDNDPGELGDTVRQLVLPVTYICNSRNVGYASAVNAACAQLQVPYVLLLNPDAGIGFEAIGRLAEVLDHNSAIAAVAPLHIDHAGNVTNPYRRIPSWLDLAAHKTRLQRFEWARLRVGRYLYAELDGMHAGYPPTPVEQPPASCLLLRRTAVAGNVMDERFPILFNDVDLSRRLSVAGWATMIEPTVSCRHEPATSTRYLGVQATAEYCVAAYRYVRKWEGRARAELFRASMVAELSAVATGDTVGRGEARRAVAALLRNRSIFDANGDGDPVRPFWPPELATSA